MMRTVLFFLFLTATAALLAAPPKEATLKAANDFYTKKNYEEAIRGYHALLKLNPQQPEVCYNLANAYYKNNQLAQAILYYEKCLFYKADHQDALINLGIANKKQADKLIPLPQLPITKKINHFLYQGCKNTIPGLAILFCWIAFIFGLIFIFSKNTKAGGFYGMILCIGMAVFLFYCSSQRDSKRNHYISVAASQSLYTAPSENSKTIFTFHEGMKYERIDQLKGWYKVKLTDGKTGWINEAGERI